MQRSVAAPKLPVGAALANPERALANQRRRCGADKALQKHVQMMHGFGLRDNGQHNLSHLSFVGVWFGEKVARWFPAWLQRVLDSSRMQGEAMQETSTCSRDVEGNCKGERASTVSGRLPLAIAMRPWSQVCSVNLITRWQILTVF